jgi:hypothetical protein
LLSHFGTLLVCCNSFLERTHHVVIFVIAEHELVLPVSKIKSIESILDLFDELLYFMLFFLEIDVSEVNGILQIHHLLLLLVHLPLKRIQFFP